MSVRSGVIFIDKPPLLADPQIAVISEIIRNSGLLIFGATVLPYALNAVDKPSLVSVVLSSLLTLLLWIISAIIVRKINV